MGFAGGFVGGFLGNLAARPFGAALDYALVYGVLGCALGTSASGRGIAGLTGFALGFVPGLAESFFRSPTYQAYGYRMGFMWVVARYGLHLLAGFAIGAVAARRRKVVGGITVAVCLFVGRYIVSGLVGSVEVLRYVMRELPTGGWYFTMDALLYIALPGALAGGLLELVDRKRDEDVK